MYLYRADGQAVIDAVQKASFSFRHEVHAGVPELGIWDQASVHRGLTHFTLLRAFPAIGMGQYKIDAVGDGLPQTGPIGVSLGDESFCTVEQVGEKVAKHLNRRLPSRKRFKVGGT